MQLRAKKKDDDKRGDAEKDISKHSTHIFMHFSVRNEYTLDVIKYFNCSSLCPVNNLTVFHTGVEVCVH